MRCTSICQSGRSSCAQAAGAALGPRVSRCGAALTAKPEEWDSSRRCHCLDCAELKSMRWQGLLLWVQDCCKIRVSMRRGVRCACNGILHNPDRGLTCSTVHNAACDQQGRVHLFITFAH